MIFGELLARILADQVHPAVAHLGDVHGVAQDAGDGRRGAHAAVLRVLGCVAVDALIGHLGRGVERGSEGHGIGALGAVDPPHAKLAEDGVDGHGAGDLASRGAAHAVSHHEQDGIGAGLALARSATRNASSL